MIKLSRRIITSICLLSASYVGAQTTFYVEGLGRAQITNDQLSLSDNVIESDTTGVGGLGQIERKNTGGYTLLDLGFNVERKDKFFLNTVLRGRDNFGLFWGEGTTFEFRRITLGGVINNGIKYELGDINVEMTPYTVYMPEVGYHKYESQIFTGRREIAEYENFIDGNTRYLQGGKAGATLLFTKGIEKMHFNGFAVRTAEITQIGTPDIIMTGINTVIDQGKFGSYGVNYVGLFDLPVSTNTQDINSSVFTVTLNPEYKLNDNVTIGIDAEIAGSNYYSQDVAISDEAIGFSGFAYDAKAKVNLKKLKTKIGVGYKMVDEDFRSPGAQSRRIVSNQTSQIFPVNAIDASGALIARNVLLFDRFTQENLYQQGVSYTLDAFNPAFNNTNPYGEATPNRQGIVANIERGSSKDALSFDIGVKLLTETDPDSTLDTQERNFFAIQSGLYLNVSKLIDWKNDIIIGGGYQSETTTRGGDADIDLTSSIIDGVLSIEAVKDFDILLGYKSYTVEGNEFLWHIDRYNLTRILDGEAKYDSQESMLSIGGRFRFTENAALSLNYNIVDSENNLTDNDDDSYKINQIFMNYTMKF